MLIGLYFLVPQPGQPLALFLQLAFQVGKPGQVALDQIAAGFAVGLPRRVVKLERWNGLEVLADPLLLFAEFRQLGFQGDAIGLGSRGRPMPSGKPFCP